MIDRLIASAAFSLAQFQTGTMSREGDTLRGVNLCNGQVQCAQTPEAIYLYNALTHISPLCLCVILVYRRLSGRSITSKSTPQRSWR